MKKKSVLFGGVGTAAIALLAGGTGFFFDMAFRRNPHLAKDKKKKSETERQRQIREEIESAMKWISEQETESLFLTSYDGLKLHATFLPAKQETGKTVLAVHGYRNYGIREYAAMAPFYHALGYNLLIVDDRGHGESEGSYVGYGWQDHFDCEKWIDYLVLRFGQKAEIFLYGISMGAATVMITSGDDLPSQVKGVIADCGYTSAVDQFRYMLKHIYHIPEVPLLPLIRQLTIRRVGYDIYDCDAKRALKRTKLPYLLIHGKKDDFVPTAMGYENYETCASEEKELLLIEGAGHAESYFLGKEIYEQHVTEFLKKWSS